MCRYQLSFWCVVNRSLVVVKHTFRSYFVVKISFSAVLKLEANQYIIVVVKSWI